LIETGDPMAAYRTTGLITLGVTWFQFVIAAAVVFLDPGYNDFPYTRIVLTYPGVLEEIHRLWALIIILAFVVNIVVIYRAKMRPKPLLSIAVAAFVLLILQAMYGAITIWNYDYPPYVVLHEGNAGVLLFITAVMACYALWGKAVPLKSRPGKM